MRLSFIILLGLTLTGCETVPPVAPLQQPHAYLPADAPALSFDPPALAGMPQLDLSRDGRGTAAFDGFASSQTTSYSLVTNDWYDDFLSNSGGRGGRYSNPNDYQRMAVTQTVGTITR